MVSEHNVVKPGMGVVVALRPADDSSKFVVGSLISGQPMTSYHETWSQRGGGGGGNSLRPYSQQRPMRTNLS